MYDPVDPIDPMEAFEYWLRANGYAHLADCEVEDCDLDALHAAIDRYGREVLDGATDGAVGRYGQLCSEPLIAAALAVVERNAQRFVGGYCIPPQAQPGLAEAMERLGEAARQWSARREGGE